MSLAAQQGKNNVNIERKPVSFESQFGLLRQTLTLREAFKKKNSKKSDIAHRAK